MDFSHIRDDISTKQARNQSIKQASKKTDFTDDLIQWGLLRLAPISNDYTWYNVSMLLVF